MLNNYICALDIGSHKIAAAVAKIKKKRINNIFFECVPSKGIKYGAIVDSIELLTSISNLMKNLKAKSGINIKFLHTNVSGQDIVTKHSHAIVPLAERGNKVITVQDLQRVNEQARILGLRLEEETIHLIPSSYSIDSKSNISNPLGLYSHTLEVDLYLICVKSSSIQSLSHVINQSGYEIQDLSFSGLSTSKTVFNAELKGNGLNLFCDIGSDITELLIFRNGILKDVDILRIGGDDLTNKLSHTLKITFDLAEDIKRSYGTIGETSQIREDKEILVKKNNLYKPIKQRLVSEIISNCAKLICTNIKDAVKQKVSCDEIDNFIIVGRTVLLEGFIETLENALSIPVKLGRITNTDILASIKDDVELSGQRYLTYLTALGMIYQAIQDKSRAVPLPNKPTGNFILKAINKFKEVYQEYF